ncbi:MAG: hypothetical protein J6U83_04685 [Bacteroidales bacterium]|nr:hypothetical protein [Bacteroidales bacterium]
MKMFRKFTLCAALLLFGTAAIAQNAYDALRFSEQYQEGTARSVAMGNAFTALGGDMGGITINPASSAVYRYSEFVITPSLQGISNSVNYLGNASSHNNTKFGISNLGFVGSYNTGRRDAGLVNWSFGLVVNKMNNFTNGMNARGTTNSTSWLSALASQTNGHNAASMDLNDSNDPFVYSNASWNSILAWNNTLLDTLPGTRDQYIAATENLDGYDISVGGDLDQIYRNKALGNVTEATINFGGNFSNKLFVGVNLGIRSITYKYDEKYGETALNSNNFNSGFESFSTAYRYRATGSGINLKAGVIYVPVDWLRLGAGISTPTWTYIDETWENEMGASFNDGYSQNILSPIGTYNYSLTSPFRWNVGAALRLGVLGVVSADFESVDYSKAILDDNEDIQDLLGTQNIVRVGAEVNVTPYFAVRAGYQHYSSPYSDATASDNKNIGSFGIGYITECGASDFFVDLTWQQLLNKGKENFSLYADTEIPAPVGTNKVNNWKVLLSLGFRF